MSKVIAEYRVIRKEKYDKIIIGAGLYGLWAAWYAGKKGERVLVLEYDDAAFQRATYINQARVHNGYHYPRSLSTAMKSAHYFERFNRDFDFAILKKFSQIYATSDNFSWTDAEQFRRFCKNAHISCKEIASGEYFKVGTVSGAFETEEYTYDANLLKNFLLQQIQTLPSVQINYGVRIRSIVKDDTLWQVELNDATVSTPYILNATYASVNQILSLVGGNVFPIKYELCEIILCEVSERLKDVGLTVMDGPFFSIMPFGKTSLHSLTSVTFTPHKTSRTAMPEFDCMSRSEGNCCPQQLGNCNSCVAKPHSAWAYMSSLAKKYLQDDLQFNYKQSLFSMKPILQASEIDDSRPTVIQTLSQQPTFVSVLSGKINTVYDLEEIL